MSIGISTACYYPLETEEALKEVGKAGAKVTEIFINSPRELNASFIDMLRDIAEYYSVRIAALHTYTAAADSYIYYSNYPRRFEDGLDTIRRTATAAAELGAKYIIMHGDKKPGKLPDEEVAEHFMIMESVANEFGVSILQENVNRFRSADPEFIKSMRYHTDDKMKFCLDIKQSVRAGHSPYDMINAMGNKIHHVHISDHNAASDCLLPLRGKFDFPEFFKKMNEIGYCGDYVIEVYNNCYENVEEITKTLNFPIFKP